MSDHHDHMTASSERMAIAEPLTRLIAVFQQQLAGVHFPGADGAVLDEAAERVRAAAAEVGEAEALVDAARATLHEAEQELLHKGQRALAYARIYAEESPALAAVLDAIVLPRVVAGVGEAETVPSGASPEPRRRGRPRKVATAPLFSLRESDASDAGALPAVPGDAA